MNRSNFWKLILVVFAILWSFYEIYPPKSRDLVLEFRERAVNFDPAFSNILARLDVLQKERPGRAFTNIIAATGTNDLTKYFPFYEAKNEVHPTRFILNQLQRDAAGKLKLGLDLQGGTSFLVAMDTNKLARIDTVTNSAGLIVTVTNRIEDYQVKGALDQAVEVLRRRVDRFGVAEPLIQPAGTDRILVQLPGLSDEDREDAKNQISKAAFLEFRMVHEKSAELLRDHIPAPGYEILRLKSKDDGKSDAATELLVRRKAELNGDSIKRAGVNRSPTTGQPEIDFELNAQGAEIFSKVTRDNLPKDGIFHRLAIVLDGELITAPEIHGEIGARGQITGNFEDKEAFAIANALENPLKAPLITLSEKSVAPSLGEDSIKSGLHAAIYGTLAVAVFMLVYYLLAGLVANIALITNLIILLGVMCSVGTTLTLPGIAGIVLTVGMAVDANVLIYERIREELAKGKSLRGAVTAGYARAFGTIFDSHVTTLISSVILIFMGTGSVKGFGVALTIGVAASLFTALIVTRMIFDFLLDRGWLKTLPMLHFIRATKLDFMKLAKPAFALSWIIIIIGIGYGLHRGKGMLGVDFIGGDTTIYEFSQKVDVEKVRDVLKQSKIEDVTIQYQGDLAGGKETLRVTSGIGTGDAVKQTLTQISGAHFRLVDSEHVGATIGKEIQKAALIAALMSLFGILVYVAFRYEFSFAVAAVVAVIHDVLMTIGMYCLTGLGSHPREFNATMVAAVLTIIGFSINDTIVVFDRIREDLKLGVRGTFRELINQALNQTLSRTIITSGTVFLATMSLYIFGGGVVNDFAFTFLAGIVTGTYSSIYIASALVLWWHKGERPKTGSQVVLQGTEAAAHT